MDVVIVDYGASNLHSVAKAVQKAGWTPLVTTRPEDALHAQALIVPGVGAAADTMSHLHAAGMVEPVKEYIASGRPFLGVCMGLQALMTVSEENDGQECLDVIHGRVRRFDGDAGLKIPHMGWNNVRQVRPHPIFRGIPDGAYFYFVHSYFCDPEDPNVIIGETDYGRPFAAALAKENIVATQFHPEKSGHYGLMVYANFIADALGGGAK